MRFLLITPSLPEPPIFGSTQRTHLIHRALTGLGEVDLLVVRRHGRLTEVEEAALPQLTRVVGTIDPEALRAPPWLGAVRAISGRTAGRLLAELGALRDYEPARSATGLAARLRGRYDAVVARYLVPLCRADGWSLGAPVLLDFDDADDLVLQARLARRHGSRLPAGARLKLWRHRAIVTDRLRRCAHIYFLSPGDRGQYVPNGGSILPNIPFAPPEQPPPRAGRPLLMFVGMLTYGPNRRGVDHFLRAIWPEVRARVPAAIVRLIGDVDEADRRAWSTLPGVEVTGRVADLAIHYAAAAACIAPVYEGGGTNVKVIEAAAHGRSIVVTPFSHYGFESALRDGEAVLAAPDDAAFARHAATLLLDDGLADRLGRAGHAVARSSFSYSRFREIVHAGVARALERRPPASDL